jgi:formylglycine-generating enzyme required for sulfatase activity
MNTRSYRWHADGSEHELRLVWLPGTKNRPYPFGRVPGGPAISVQGFFIGATPVTQALWHHVMGSNPATRLDLRCPVDNVSWEDITASGGFLDKLNSGEVLEAVTGGEQLRFRLPSETEWEYAARGGPHWPDGFRFSGSNGPDEVAWYGPRWNRTHELISRILGPRRGWRVVGRLRRIGIRKQTRTHEVATKAPNQLGLFDMSGNVWEWCQDVCTDDLSLVPEDGTAYVRPGDERRLRGGCHHNWDLHCTVYWRYGIIPSAADGCIGLRVVLGV